MTGDKYFKIFMNNVKILKILIIKNKKCKFCSLLLYILIDI